MKALFVLACCGAVGCSGPLRPGPDTAPPGAVPSVAAPPVAELCTGVETHGGCISICVVREGQLVRIPVSYDPATGDTTVLGRRFSDLYPPDSAYAVSHRWYAEREPILYRGRRYVKYGLPRVLGESEVEPSGSVAGVVVFVEPGQRRIPDVIYLPVRPGCEFQPYEGGNHGAAVRGR